MSFFTQYKKLLIDTIRSELEFVKTGHVIQIKYSGDLDSATPDLVLVLNPRFEGKLHGIKLNDIPIQSTITFLNKIRTTQFVDQELGIPKRSVDLYRLPIKSEVNRPEQFYKSYIKPDPRFSKYTPYRTYIINKINQIWIIRFDFNKINMVPKFSSDIKERFPSLDFGVS